jgi:hypothetical protein
MFLASPNFVFKAGLTALLLSRFVPCFISNGRWIGAGHLCTHERIRSCAET